MATSGRSAGGSWSSFATPMHEGRRPREQLAAGLDAVRVVVAVRVDGCRRRGGRAAHDTFTPIRFMIAHCWAIESALFQLQ